MKLHLPSALRKALLAVSVVSMTVAGTTQAAIMHPSVSLQTYTDFGSNMGRYTIYQQNELLQHLNKDGVRIIYTQGEAPYQLGQKMISYESMVDGGPFTAISYNATATVRHNGVTNPVFTGRFIGSENSIHYAGIEYRSCENNTFLLTPEIDYKITRLSKIITDITPSALYDARAHKLKGEDIGHMLQYRAGGGYMQQADEEGKTTWLTGAYTYVVGGIVTNSGFGYSRGYDYVNDEGKKDVRNITDDSYTVSIIGVDGWGADTAGTPTHPLPFVTQGGDSGSPVWVWNQESQAYELLSCHQARGSYDSYSRGASEWTKDTLDYFCVDVDMDAAKHEVHLQAVLKADETTYRATANGNTTASTTPMHGSVTNAEGTAIEGLDFIGVRNGINTWANLVDLKDDPVTVTAGKEQIQHWYAYGNEYLNANNTTGNPLQYADLFMTENLVFQSSATDNNIILDADVDLGIGYAQFSKTSGSDKASFTISGHDDDISRDYNFNHAGYIVDKDVDVHLKIANREVESETGKDYFREWRKTGEGDLYLEGTGDNHIFLNVGGKGTTFLREQGNGYAAYNVLINNGATVNLGGNINQVERDVTFGYGGGVLDFAGNVNMEWNNTNNAEAPGFTIHALTQDAIITNTTGTTTLTYREGGNTNFLGSFKDTADSSLNIVYAGNGIWTLNSIHTDLKNGGLEVQTGTVKLVGTLTEHAQGSLTGYNQQRYSNPDDWHYADAAMNVTVNSGATFELGSHARLKGTVTVEGGGIFQMDEGVRHQKEYIEGWYELEDTCIAEMRQFYGLHGDVNLKEANSQMVVKFSDGTDANTTVTGKIYGDGGMTVDTAGGSLTLSGANTFEGTKTVTNGLLILDSKEAAGNTANNQWKLQDKAQLAVNDAPAAEALKLVDNTSSGVLVLTGDETDAPINMQGYNSLIIGAEAGKKIQFGTENSQEKFRAVEGKWNLGGGGGNLVVNYKLDDNKGTLVLGNAHTTGSVTLTNTANNIHAIYFAGKVTLAYTDQLALGNAAINLSYTNRIMGAEGTLGLINHDADGVMLLDNMANATIDLTEYKDLHLGSEGNLEYGGEIKLGVDEYVWDDMLYRYSTYYFGGITGNLKLTKALKDQNDTSTNLVLDAQTYSGGVLELQKALEITGSVSVAGQEPYSGHTGGSITLKVNATDSFASTEGGILLYDGGTLDINGFNQTLSFIDAYEGSHIIDSSENKNGTLKIDSAYSSLEGSVDVGTLVINAGSGVPDSESHLYLRGENTYRDFNIESGQVHVESQQALCATGRTILEKDAKMIIANCTATANLELQGSTVVLGDVEETGKPIGHLAGSLKVTPGTIGTVDFAVDGSTLSAVVDTGKDGTLKLIGNIGTVSSPLVNADGSEEDVSGEHESGGTVIVELKELRLAGSGSTIGGELKLKGQDNNLTLRSQTYGNNMQREINHLDLQDDLNLTITEQSYNTIWNFHKLSGKGNITWKSGTVHWFSSRIVLDGSNSFEGTFTAERTDVDKQGRHYGTFVELAHNEALQNATLIMHGKETTEGKSMMTLAVNTDNAKLRGLTGDEYTAIYAGASIEGESKSGGPLKIAPSSVRSAKLTITGGGAYDFKGNVYGGEDDTHNGLDIVMDGIGIQNFSGREVTVNSVTAKQGELVLSADSLTIKDRATIYRGATLGTGNNEFTLGPNMALMVAGSGSGAAQLDSVLRLDGGSIGFEGTSINTSEYALSVKSVEKGSQTGLDVHFESTADIRENVAYKLASGNAWTCFENSAYHATGLNYYDAAFNAQNEGLTVTFTLKKDNNIWLGSKDKSTWDDNNFGISPEVPGEGKTTVFNNLAESRDVQVQGQQHAAKLLFDSTKEYTLEGKEAGASLAANSLLQTGSGTTKLGSGVRINGAVDVQAGTLVLQDGSHANSAAVAKGATLQLESAAAFEGTVAGEGDVKVAWQGEQQGTLGTAETGIGSLTVESGKLNAADTLNVQRSASVLAGATLQSSTGNILAQEGQPLQLAGTLVIDTSNSNMELKTDVTDHNGTLGSVEKIGANTLTVKSSLVADTLAVKQGRVEIKDSGILMEFLDKTQNLEAVNGGYALLGGNAFTLESDEYTTNLLVGGSKSTIELALGQHSTKTFQGELSMTDGGTLKLYDGGVQINGKITLGVGGSDRVTLWGNWGEANSASKAGIILAGEVCGSGTVVLDKGGNAKNQCVTLINDGNTFDGTYEVNDKTSLVVGADSAIRDASVNMKGGSLVVRADASTKSLVSDSGKGLIQIEEGKSLGLQNTNYSGQIKFAEDVTVTANVSGTVAQLTGDVTLESTEAGKATITGAENTSLANACINLSAGTSLKINKVTMAGQAAITGADGSRVENSLIDLAAGTRLEMANVVLASSSSITDASATLLANGLVVEADKTNLEYNSVAGALTPLTYGATATPEEAPAGQIACFTLSNIQDVAIEGTGLVVSLTGDSSQMLGGADWLRLSLGNEGKFTEGLDVTLLYKDAAGQQLSAQGVYTFEDVEAQAAAEEATRQYDYVYFRITGTVPEPATGTLSLLALAALAARRRRK